MRRNIFCSFVCALVFVACSSSGNHKSVQCEEVSFVDAFPKEVELGETSALPLDLSDFSYWRGKGKSELQFFDWSGRPLLRLKLPFLASSFHISGDRYVYVFSSLSENESLYKYDCGEALRGL